MRHNWKRRLRNKLSKNMEGDWPMLIRAKHSTSSYGKYYRDDQIEYIIDQIIYLKHIIKDSSNN